MRRWSRAFGGTNAFLGAGLEAGQSKMERGNFSSLCTTLSFAGVGGCQFV